MIKSLSDLKENLSLYTRDRDHIIGKKLIKFIEEYITPSEYDVLYVKNIYNDNKIEVLFIGKEKMASVLGEEEAIKTTLKYSNIKCLEFKKPRDVQDGVELKIIFEDESELVLHSLKDSNESWNGDYEEGITKIFKALS